MAYGTGRPYFDKPMPWEFSKKIPHDRTFNGEEYEFVLRSRRKIILLEHC